MELFKCQIHHREITLGRGFYIPLFVQDIPFINFIRLSTPNSKDFFYSHLSTLFTRYTYVCIGSKKYKSYYCFGIYDIMVVGFRLGYFLTCLLVSGILCSAGCSVLQGNGKSILSNIEHRILVLEGAKESIQFTNLLFLQK